MGYISQLQNLGLFEQTHITSVIVHYDGPMDWHSCVYIVSLKSYSFNLALITVLISLLWLTVSSLKHVRGKYRSCTAQWFDAYRFWSRHKINIKTLLWLSLTTHFDTLFRCLYSIKWNITTTKADITEWVNLYGCYVTFNIRLHYHYAPLLTFWSWVLTEHSWTQLTHGDAAAGVKSLSVSTLYSDAQLPRTSCSAFPIEKVPIHTWFKLAVDKTSVVSLVVFFFLPRTHIIFTRRSCRSWSWSWSGWSLRAAAGPGPSVGRSVGYHFV